MNTLILISNFECGFLSIICGNKTLNVPLEKLQNTAENLLGALDGAITKAGIKLADIDTFGVCRGAGSFTGIRNGVSLIIGLNAVAGRKTVAFTSFDMLKWANYSGVLIQKAYGGGVYILEGTEPVFVSKEELLAYRTKPIVCFKNEQDFFKQNGFTDIVSVDEFSAATAVVAEKIDRAEFVNLNLTEPLYVVASQAERGLAEKMKSVKVEHATAADLDAVFEIEKDCFCTADLCDAFSRDSLKAELVKKTNKCFKIIFDGKLAGYIILSVTSGEAEIVKIAISPLHQGKGLAKTLYNGAIDMVKPRLHKIFLEVNKNNQKAINLYRALGFKEIGVRRGYYKDGADALVFGQEVN